MLANNQPAFLLASHDPVLLAKLQPVLASSGARVDICMSAEPALNALTAPHPLDLAIIDATMPGVAWDEFLSSVRTGPGAKRSPILILAPSVEAEWSLRLAESVIDDLAPREIANDFLLSRVETVLRTRKMTIEFEMMREAAVLTAQVDRLTGVFNRETLLSMLFRETDRVQRMKSSLCMILFDVDDFGHWNTRLGSEACDDLLGQIASRSARLLRSYDLLGRVGKDEFLVGLPGCSEVNALLLAERMRYEVFATPFQVNEETVRLSACFGVTSSQGRSPLVVLREAEQALVCAKETGPETIHCAGESSQSSVSPFAYLPASNDQLFAW